jgi:predicted membrane protein
MGFVSRAFDKLPAWAQLLLMTAGLASGVYGFAHYGWSFVLKAIFSPLP